MMGLWKSNRIWDGARCRVESRRSVRGFTLIEILIVVVVLGIIAALTVPHFGQATDEAEETAAHSQLNVLRGQVTLYWAKYGNITPLGSNMDQVIRTLTNEGMLAAPLSDSDPSSAGFQVSGGYTLIWDENTGTLDAYASDGSSSGW